MFKKQLLRYSIIACVVLAGILFTNFFSTHGNIDITVFNNTRSEQIIWFEPKEKFTYHIPAGDKVRVDYSTDFFSTSLLMGYFDQDGSAEVITIWEYVEKSYHGKIAIKINQSDQLNKIEFNVSGEIGP